MNKVFRLGILFTAIGQYSVIIVQLILNVVLSRIISVEEFGIVANAQVFLLFLQIILTSGIGPAIIQEKDLDDNKYGTLFNFTLLFSLSFVLVFVFLGYIVSIVYHNKIYINLFFFLSFVIFFEGVNIVPRALLNKELRFRELNIRVLVGNVLGAIGGIIAAFRGLGIYALVLSLVIPTFFAFIANLFIVKIKYNWRLEFSSVKHILHVSKNQMGYASLNYISRYADNLLVGKFLGPIALANYQKSFQLISMPNTVFLGVVTPVLQPILSNYQENKEIIKSVLLRIVHIIALLAFPLSVFMTLNAQKIILFLFGPSWNNAVMPFCILSFSIWAQMLMALTSSVFISRNHSHTLFKNGVVSLTIILPLIIVGIVSHNLEIVAICVSIAHILNFFVSYWILMKYVLDGSLLEILKELITPFMIGCATLIICFILNNFLLFDNLFLSLLIRGIVWIFIVLLLLILTGELSKVKSFFYSQKS